MKNWIDWENVIVIIVVGIVALSFVAGFFGMIAWVNSPTEFIWTIKIEMDNNTYEIMNKSLEIQKEKSVESISTQYEFRRRCYSLGGNNCSDGFGSTIYCDIVKDGYCYYWGEK